MSIVRTIMKIVLIIIGFIAFTAAHDRDPDATYYITGYYAPYRGREEYQKEIREEYGLPSRGAPRSYGDNRNVPYPFQRIGIHGLGFENRLAFADGLRNPVTPYALEHAGYRPTYKDLQYVPI